MNRALVLLLLLVASAIPAAAELTGAEITTEPLRGDLGTAIEAARTDWVAWQVPRVEGAAAPCCWRQNRECRLGATDGRSFSAQLAPHDNELMVYVRPGESGLELYAPSCDVSARGATVLQLLDVDVAVSATWLTSRLERADPRHADEILAALALHDHPPVTSWLEEQARGEGERAEEAVFWLGEARGEPGYQALERLLERLPRGEVRSKIPFALQQSPVPVALDRLIELAHRDDDPKLRKEAVFWLAQKAGVRAAAAIGDSIDQDPELEVKRAAVFALSQLPTDEGVPRLIDVAQNHAHPQIRKEALFWLGESEDPRALDLIVALLQSE